MNSIKKMGQKGFTIVELLIVIVIIGILAALVFVQFNGMQQRSRDAERVSDLRLLDSKIAEYYADQGVYPEGSSDGDISELQTALSETLAGTIEAEAFEDPRDGDAYRYFSDGEDYRLEADLEDDDEMHTRGSLTGSGD